MQVTPELPVRTLWGTGNQVGWFKTRPYVEPMPDTVCVIKHGMVVADEEKVREHPNFTPL